MVQYLLSVDRGALGIFALSFVLYLLVGWGRAMEGLFLGKIWAYGSVLAYCQSF